VATTTGSAVPATTALAPNDLVLNGFDVAPSLSDGISSANSSASAIAIANAIYLKTAQTGVTAQAQPAIFTGTQAIGAVTVDPAVDQMKINGITIFDATTVVAANDATSTLRNAINAKTNQTGVTASIDVNNKLVLTAADGRNIAIQTTGATKIADQLSLQAADGNFNNTATPTGGTVKIMSNNAIVVSGNNVGNAGLVAQTYPKDPNTALNTVSLSTVGGSNMAITVVDNALAQVNQIRAGLGAITNRLEQTIQNLQAISENLSASDSRIRDADFATETANMTRNNILQQAGIAILGQANTTTQGALKLLQG
jgi:flagellin